MLLYALFRLQTEQINRTFNFTLQFFFKCRPQYVILARFFIALQSIQQKQKQIYYYVLIIVLLNKYNKFYLVYKNWKK